MCQVHCRQSEGMLRPPACNRLNLNTNYTQWTRLIPTVLFLSLLFSSANILSPSHQSSFKQKKKKGRKKKRKRGEGERASEWYHGIIKTKQASTFLGWEIWQVHHWLWVLQLAVLPWKLSKDGELVLESLPEERQPAKQ